jgi:hypothetical protein
MNTVECNIPIKLAIPRKGDIVHYEDDICIVTSINEYQTAEVVSLHSGSLHSVRLCSYVLTPVLPGSKIIIGVP